MRERGFLAGWIDAESRRFSENPTVQGLRKR